LNSDGYLDMAIGQENARSLGLFWYDYPNFNQHYISDGNYTTDGKIADIDVDGDQDIIVSCISRNRIEW
jgi:hypothetical protein